MTYLKEATELDIVYTYGAAAAGGKINGQAKAKEDTAANSSG